MNDELRTEAEAEVDRYFAEARERGREVDPSQREPMIAAALRRLSLRANPKAAGSTDAPAPAGSFKSIGRELRRILGRDVSPEEYAAAQEMKREPLAVLCLDCGDAGIRVSKAADVRRRTQLVQRQAHYGGRPLADDEVMILCDRCPPETQRARHLRGLMPPGDIIRARFNKFHALSPDQEAAVEAVQRWAEGDDPRAFLILVGPVGGGKSHLGKAAALYRAEHGERVYWMNAKGILDAIRATFDRIRDNLASDGGPGGDPSKRATFEQWATAPVLCIDDLFRDYVSEWGAAELESLIFERYEHERPTLITSNVSIDMLEEERFDPHRRLISRLNDRARVAYIEIGDAPDMRAGRVSE